MSVLMSDAYDLLGQSAREDRQQDLLYDILYADDTLLLGSAACHVEELAKAVATIGSQYGLSLHWQKTQALSVGTTTRLRRPDGTVVKDSGSMIYLGGQRLLVRVLNLNCPGVLVWRLLPSDP